MFIPALAGRAAVVASTSAAAVFIAVLPAVPATAATQPAATPAVITPATFAPSVSATTFTLPAPVAAPVPVPVVAPVVKPVALVTPAAAPVPTASTASAMQLAMSKIGTPYRYGATGPNAFDCSGLMQWAFKQVGVSLPRVAAAQAGVGTKVAKADLRPGDLVFFYSPISHVAMYIGDGKVVHASTSGKPVKISELSRMRFATARRV